MRTMANAARTGVNAQERKLTPVNVNAGNFGKLWALYADGQVVAQPLYVSGLRGDTHANPNTPALQGTFNAVLVATMHNTVYLYDADRDDSARTDQAERRRSGARQERQALRRLLPVRVRRLAEN